MWSIRHRIWVSWNRNEHISTNIHPGKTFKDIWDIDIHNLQNGWKYCHNYSYLWNYSNFPTILWSIRHRIWVSWNRNEHISTNIHPLKKWKNIQENDICNLQNGWIILWQFAIFIELHTFIYFFVFTKTLNLSNLKIYYHISTNNNPGKNTKGYMG